jgi:hypothetical protein
MFFIKLLYGGVLICIPVASNFWSVTQSWIRTESQYNKKIMFWFAMVASIAFLIIDGLPPLYVQ